MIGPTLHTTIATAPAQPAPLGLPDWAPWVLIVLGAAILAMWWTGGRRVAKGHTADAGAFGRLVRAARDRHTPAPPPSVDRDTREVVDTLLARLDDRADRLEALLTDAKQTIARLESLRAPADAPAPERRAPRAQPRPAPEPEPPLIEVATAAKPLGVGGVADPICTRVYEMADAGDDAVAIARRLDEHVGKVQLILALREQA